MGTVPVTIDGILNHEADKSTEKVHIVGQLSITGLSVGGGPAPPQPPDVPPPDPGTPTFPIWGPPGITLPPVPGYPPVAGHPLPEPEPEPPQGPAYIPVWHPDYGWIVIPAYPVPTPSKKK